MPIARDTGFPGNDAQDDFLRARRRRVLARLSALLRFEAGDVDLMLSYDEVVEALGRVAQRDLGVVTIAIDAIVGTVDRGKEFDRAFRPTSARVRARFEQIAGAQRRGTSMPPIDVYRIGALHFVRDGHHRVAVARAQGREEIDARVIEVTTRVPADDSISAGDLPLKSHARVFGERVPLPQPARERIALTDPFDFGVLAEGVEAWGFRLIQHDGLWLDRAEVARAGSPRSTSPSSPSCARPTSSAAASRRPMRTYACRPIATGSCARTRGATRRSSACGAGAEEEAFEAVCRTA